MQKNHQPESDRLMDDLMRNKIETVTTHILTPYPGTRLREERLKEGRIHDFDWDHYNTSFVVFKPKSISEESLRREYLRFYRRLYSVKNIWRRKPRQFRQALAFLGFNFVYRKFGKLASVLHYFLPMKKIFL